MPSTGLYIEAQNFNRVPGVKIFLYSYISLWHAKFVTVEPNDSCRFVCCVLIII
jgi:hypothetical protein